MSLDIFGVWLVSFMGNKPGINAKLLVKLYFFIAILMDSCVVAEFSNNISIMSYWSSNLLVLVSGQK